MTCRTARTWITDAVEGLLDPARGAELERHTAACRRCRETLESHRRLRALLSATPRASEMPASVASSVSRGLRPLPRTPRPVWRLVVAASTFVTVCGALALAVYSRAPDVAGGPGIARMSPADVVRLASPISTQLCVREHAQASFFYARADKASWSLAVTESNKANVAW